MKKNIVQLVSHPGIAFIAVFVAIVAGTVLSPVHASAGIYSDWAQYGNPPLSEGYFSNGGASDTAAGVRAKCVPDPNARCPVLPNDNYANGKDAFDRYSFHGGDASLAESEVKARKFVSDLRNKYNGQGEWGATGAAFIVNSLLGRGSDSVQKTRVIDDATWNDVENRLVDRARKGKIQWNVLIDNNGRYDTYTVNIKGRWDIAYEHKRDIQNGMVVLDDDTDPNTFAFRMWYSCANPIGDFTGLPPVEASNFSLTPSVSVGGYTVIEPNTPVNVSGTVTNGGSTASTNTQWQLVRVVVDAGQPVPTSGTNSGTAPCDGYYPGCEPLQSGSSPGGYPAGGPWAVTSFTDPMADVPVGAQICFGLSVQPRSSDSGEWAHSVLVCLTVTKKPSINVTGGDVIVGKGLMGTPSKINTSTSVKTIGTTDTRVFGSWGEYAVIADGAISGMASGAGYAGGKPSGAGPVDIFCSVSYLTLTNAGSGSSCDSTATGNYVIDTGFPAIEGEFTAPGDIVAPYILGGSAVLADLANSGVYTTSGSTLTIRANTAANIPKGRWIVINAPNAVVTIENNITYTTEDLSQPSEIPQVIIIANEINISQPVEQVDAWLVATGPTGKIDTCVGFTPPLNAKQRDKRLTVNGPVVARKLLLNRTAGATTGTDTDLPAEVFNLRPDAYLWASSHKSGSYRLQTTSTVELPPRY